MRIILLVLLVLMALGAAGYCARAKAQGTNARTGEGLSMSLGTVIAGPKRCFTGFLLAQEFAERRWLGYLVTHGDSSDCIEGEPMRANIGAGIIRTTQLGKWSFGFGIGAYEHGDIAIGPDELEQATEIPRVANRAQVVAAILIRRLILNDRVVIDLLHNSTGGSSDFNYGLNYVTLGLRF